MRSLGKIEGGAEGLKNSYCLLFSLYDLKGKSVRGKDIMEKLDAK